MDDVVVVLHCGGTWLFCVWHFLIWRRGHSPSLSLSCFLKYKYYSPNTHSSNRIELAGLANQNRQTGNDWLDRGGVLIAVICASGRGQFNPRTLPGSSSLSNIIWPTPSPSRLGWTSHYFRHSLPIKTTRKSRGLSIFPPVDFFIGLFSFRSSNPYSQDHGG
jgi:hypothetical protein